jgi:2',3'-cyclic-nucleotide 2'-phosphodiesterase (5'-nucleotidase family)
MHITRPTRWRGWLCAAALALLAGCAGFPAARPAPLSAAPTATVPVYATAPAGAAAPAAAPAVTPPAPAAGPVQLTLLHTNDTFGYLLPCG